VSSAGGTAGSASKGGASGTAASTSTGGKSASGGAGGSAGTLGGVVGAAGSSRGGAGGASGGSAGASATAGAGGTSGAGGNAGAGGGNELVVAAALDGFRLLDPCQSSYKAVATPGDVCPQDNSVKNQHQSVSLRGEPSTIYDVTVRVRGIMEGYWYTGGSLDPVSKTFYTGGVPTIGGFASACKNMTNSLGLPFSLPPELSPTDNCWNGFNMFGLLVSAPKQAYYLNYTAEKVVDRPPHAVYRSDYVVTIPMRGDATLDFYIIGSDEHECYNFDQVVPGLDLTPNPYVGDFVQFDVVSVTRHATGAP